MKIILGIKLFVISFLFNSFLFGQSILPTNSSPVGMITAPIGWTLIIGTTDISDKDKHGGITDWYGGGVEDPPNGHTVWVSGTHVEKVGTTISDLIIGEEYTVIFYTAELGTGISPDDGTLVVTIGDESYLFPYSGGIDYTWHMKSITFVADDEEMLMTFNYELPEYSYWNVSFGEAVYFACDSLESEISSTQVCLGEEVTFNVSSVNGGLITWEGGIENDEPFTPPVGTSVYIASSDHEDDCAFEVEINVHNPEVTASVNDNEICLGESIVFSASGADSYSWDLGVVDGELHTPDYVGTEIYTVIGVDSVGCVNTDSIEVFVEAI
uniref:hypothetical protein n=1 Tax=Crocinitomix algicola TaxID=1740263 RepID=UPI001112E1BC